MIWTKSGKAVPMVTPAGRADGAAEATNRAGVTVGYLGNLGTDDDPESERVWAAGFVVRSLTRGPSSWRSTGGLHQYLVRYGVLGTGPAGTNSFTPARVAGGHTWRNVSAGFSHTCGITTVGDAYCWGYGAMGQLGNGSIADQSTPQPVQR